MPGDREWGGRMQDDLTDAVAFVDRAGLGRPGAGGDLRRLLRRLRGAGRGGVHPGPVLLCRRHRGPVQPEDADRDDPALLGADGRPVPPPGGAPGEGCRLPLVPLAAVAGGRHPHPACSSRRAPTTRGSSRPSPSRSSRRCERRESTTSTCCSPTKATASPSRRTALLFYAAADRFLARHLGGRSAGQE